MSEPDQDVLIVDGMFCAACAASVEATLARHAAIARASVNFAADAAVIQWAPGARARDGVIAAVAALGYSARFAGDDHGPGPAQDPARGLSLRLVIAIFFGMWTMLPSIALYLDVASDASTRFALALAAGLLSLPVVAWSGWPFYRMGVATLRAGVAGIDTLITFGVAGSIALSAVSLVNGGAEVYFEVAVALITLQLVARLIELRTRRRARNAVLGLLELAPSTVRRIGSDGREVTVALRDVEVGMQARVRPGERIAVDGNVIGGRADVDRSLLSGQADPVTLNIGDAAYAGERVLDGALTIDVTAAAGGRRVDQLARQVRRMLATKPHWQRVVERVARHFLWLSAVAALVAAALALGSGESAAAAAVRALAVFVIACPCALSLAAPLGGLSAAAAAAGRGIVLRDLSVFTAGAKPTVVFVDKTGTLTAGRPLVIGIEPAVAETAESVLGTAAIAERDSEHPLARAIVEAADAARAKVPIRSEGVLSVQAGRGVRWSDGQTDITVARMSALDDDGVSLPALPPTTATRVGVARDGRFVGAIELADSLRPGAAGSVAALRSRGIDVVMLSGDDAAPVAAVAAELGISAHAALSPEEKLAHVEAARSAGATVAFVGDGLNDGLALAAADISIAVDGATDVATSAAAVAFLNTDIGALPWLLDLTRRTRRIIYQNLAWSIAYNAVAVPAAVAGWVHPAVAAAAMALSSMSVAFNSMRVGGLHRSLASSAPVPGPGLRRSTAAGA